MHNNPMLPQPILEPAPTTRPEEQIELKTYLHTIWNYRWLIAGIALLFLLLGVAYAFLAKPVYQANMLIHVEEDTARAQKNILSDMGSMFETKAAAISEIELLRSRMVVSRAVDNLRLYIDVQPKYFPLVGGWLAGRSKELSTPGLFGFGGYVWGAEKMDVSVFNVPDTLLSTDFVLTAGANGQYRLTEKDAHIDLVGQAGTLLNANTEKGNIELMVDKLNANPGARFTLKRSSRLTTIENVQKSMVVAEQGKQSGIISVTLQGNNPQQIHSILSVISREYMHQNLARKTEEAEKSLAFLNAQLPELKQQLEQSEAKYNQYRNTHGTIDLGEEAKISLQQSAAAKTRRIELLQKKTEMLTRFTNEHPIVQGINNQLREIDNEIKTVSGHIKTLPNLEQDVVRLSREVKVNSDLYTALSHTAQQLRMITAGKVSNVRMVDAPMIPTAPVKPNRPMVIGIAAALGLFLGVLAALLRKSLNDSIEDPNKIEKMLGSRVVYATIPHSSKQKMLLKNIPGNSRKIPILAKDSPEDIAVESLRNFRTALQFAMPQFRNNIVVLTGPTPGVGKSFVSVNFAAVMAATGKRVLLIDSDLRQGHLHQYFGLERKGGLSDCITGTLRLEQTIHRGVIENMDFLSTGLLPPNPSEFLLHQNFEAILTAVSGKYDMVLIDPPPVLAVSDALIIASHAGAVFILTRAGVTTEGEINETIKRLNHSGVSPKGILFNDMKLRAGGYGYNYGYGYGSIKQVEFAAT